MKPIFALDHLVKERYPRFIDAIRDLDDALCLVIHKKLFRLLTVLATILNPLHFLCRQVHLFAALPSEKRVTAQKTLQCQELVRHWQFYVAKSRSLRKVFVSVKGVYFQASIMGEDVTWLCPHPFTQVVPPEVDIRVMATFLEFYEVFMKFVLFKLYHTIQLRYPPNVDVNMKDAGGFLLAVQAASLEGPGPSESNNLVINSIAVTDTASMSKDESGKSTKNKLVAADPLNGNKEKLHAILAKDQELSIDTDVLSESASRVPSVSVFQSLMDDVLQSGGQEEEEDEERRVFRGRGLADQGTDPTQLFTGLRFFINREVNLEWAQLCIFSFGGLVGWDGELSPYGESDPRITHQVVDRPLNTSNGHSREYVQPQWVFDCINARVLLPTLRYQPNVALPPHLSPFVDDVKEGYVPLYQDELTSLKAGGVVSGGKEEEERRVEGEEGDKAVSYEEEVRAERLGERYSARKGVGSVKEELDEGGEEEEAAVDAAGEGVEVSLDSGARGVEYVPSAVEQTEVSV